MTPIEVEERLDKLERVFAFVKLTSEAEFPNRTLTLKYRFVHVLYQNALYAGLRATRKATLSRDVALALAGCYGERTASVASELALLWEAAREYAHAADCFLQAARNAARVHAHREAVRFAERGLEAVRKLPDTPERNGRELGLQLALGFSLQSVRSWGASETGAAFTRARTLCEQTGDDPRVFAALVGVWAYHLVRAQYETAHGLCAQMLQTGRAISRTRRCWLWPPCVGPRSTILKATFSRPGNWGNARSTWIAGNTTRRICPSGPKTADCQRAESTASVCGCLAIRIEPWRWRMKRSGWPSTLLIHSRLGAAHHTRGSILSFLRDWQSGHREFEKVFTVAEEHALGDILKHATASHALNLAYQEPTDEALERATRAIASLNAQGVMLGRTRYLARMGEAFWLADRCGGRTCGRCGSVGAGREPRGARR